MRTVLWFISVLVRGRPFPSYAKVFPCLTIIAQLIHKDDLFLQELAVKSLDYLTESKDEETLKEITSYGFIPKVVKLINCEDESIAYHALRVIGNLSFGDLEVTQQLLKNDIFTMLEGVLNPHNRRKKSHRNEACYILSNIIADRSPEQNFYVLNFITPRIIEHLSDSEWEIRSEATCCVSNFLYNCSLDDGQTLVQQGLLTPLLLNLQDQRTKLLENTLIALKRIFTQGQELRKHFKKDNVYVSMVLEANAGHLIEAIQGHKDDNIFNLASELLAEYFPTEEI